MLYFMQSGIFPPCFVVMNKYFDILIKRYVIFVLLSWVVMYLSLMKIAILISALFKYYYYYYYYYYRTFFRFPGADGSSALKMCN